MWGSSPSLVIDLLHDFGWVFPHSEPQFPNLSNGGDACMLSRFSRVRPFEILWIVDCQAPLSVAFSRQECWSGLPCPSPGDLPNPGLEPASHKSPALADRVFTTSTTWEAQLTIFCLFLSSFAARHPAGGLQTPTFNYLLQHRRDVKSNRVKSIKKTQVLLGWFIIQTLSWL